MSSTLVRQFAAMMPRLRSREMLELTDVLAIGSGATDKKAREKWLSRTTATAMGHNARRAARASSWEDHFAKLRANGFSVTVDGEQA